MTAPGRARRFRPLQLLPLLVLVACAGGSPDDRAAVDLGADALRVIGTDDLRFDPDELVTDEGVIEVALSCEAGVNHNLVIVSTGEEIAACRPGQTVVGAVELEAGTYGFVCTVPGHSATMRGELTVG